jgi:hydrogenase nickel incorporation protein HypA/HybF
MHELGIADSILDAARAEARRQGGARLVKVGMKLGEVAGVDPAALSFCFESLVIGTELEPLALEIEHSPHRHRCPSCRREFHVVDYRTECPGCGETHTKFLGGDEMEIIYLEVDDT